MSSVYHEVGEEFEFMDVLLKVLPNPTWKCSMCYFLSDGRCVSVDKDDDYPKCITDFREDGKSVYFEEIKP